MTDKKNFDDYEKKSDHVQGGPVKNGELKHGTYDAPPKPPKSDDKN